MESFESWDGLRIAYSHYGRAETDQPRVVLHHGFAASGHLNWVLPGVVDALVRAGRRVTTIDARGHGDSEKPHNSERYGEVNMSKDLVGLFDHLGEPAYDLVGYSMGAVVALITAVKEPRIRRLVIGGVGAGVVECGGVDARVLPPEAIAEALGTDDPRSIRHPGARAMRALADHSGADRRALQAQCSAVHREPIALSAIMVPTLLLAGDDDPLAQRPEVLAGAINDARTVMVRGGHEEAVADPCFAEQVVRFIAA